MYFKKKKKKWKQNVVLHNRCWTGNLCASGVCLAGKQTNLSHWQKFKAEHFYNTSQLLPDVSREKHIQAFLTESSLLCNTGLRTGRGSNSGRERERQRNWAKKTDPDQQMVVISTWGEGRNQQTDSEGWFPGMKRFRGVERKKKKKNRKTVSKRMRSLACQCIRVVFLWQPHQDQMDSSGRSPGWVPVTQPGRNVGQ